MTDQAQARPGHEHVAAVRQRLAQQRWSWIEWWNAEERDQENGGFRQSRSATPASVIADVLEAAAELGLLAGHAIPTVASATRIVLERITQAAEAYLTRSAEADEARRAELRRHLADATTDAWMLLRPNSAGVGSDQDAPSGPHVRPQAAEQADPVAQYPPERLRASEAVPDDVLQAAGAAAWPGLPAQQLDQLAAERAAGYQSAPDFDGFSTVGRREAQREGERAVREGLAAALDARAQADTTWPGPDLAEVGKWAQDFTTDEDGAPGSVSELDDHLWEEWGRTVGARTDRDRYRQLAILAAWVVATMRELRLRETRRESEPAQGGHPDRRGLLASLVSDAQDLGTYDLGASHDPDDAYQAGRLDEAVTAGQPTIGVLRDVVDLAAELLSDSSFHERGHPGYAARRTGWIAETRLAALRARLDRARAALTNLEPDQETRRG